MLEQTATADLFKHTLSQIPSIFGRLVYLASLRDPNSGIYEHYGLGSIFGREESRKALQESHARVFQEWLNLSLPGKRSDLLLYLRGVDDGKRSVLRRWERAAIHRTYVPDSARKSETALFLEEFEVLLQILNCGGGGAKRDPRSSRSE
ncbi:MAG TPA: hypothetical protein VFW83_10700 [Bryobacteraceae bacterium]|nr:hypothetical protein [Bryobacteraceae bacterium]